MPANPLAPQGRGAGIRRCCPTAPGSGCWRRWASARDRLVVTWLGDGGLRIGELCGLHLVDLHLREDAACGECRTPHVHVCHRPDNPNQAEAKTKHPWRIEDGIVTRRADQAGQPGDDPHLLRLHHQRVPARRHRITGCCWCSCTATSAGQPWAPVAARADAAPAPGNAPGWAWSSRTCSGTRFASAVLDASGGNLLIARDAGGWASAAIVDEIYGHADVHDPAFDAALRTVWGESSDRRNARLRCRPCIARPDREARDRLEILTALIDGPSFDPMFRPDVIEIPRRSPGLPAGSAWSIAANGHARAAPICAPSTSSNGCTQTRERGVGQGRLPRQPRQGSLRHVRVEELPCRICPDRPVAHSELQLCQRHLRRGSGTRRPSATPPTSTSGCADQAAARRLRAVHGDGAARAWRTRRWGCAAGMTSGYHRDGRPGGAALPSRGGIASSSTAGRCRSTTPTSAAFRRWCATTPAPPVRGQINLLGLRPLVAAEINWGLFTHTQGPGRSGGTWAGSVRW